MKHSFADVHRAVIDRKNTVRFKTARTSAIRMKVELQKGVFAGRLAWKVN